MSADEVLGGLYDLSRPGNAFAAGVLTLIGAFVAGAGIGDTIPMTTAGVVTVMATAGGNALNDYIDRDIDRVNQPERPIPRRAITPEIALVYSGALFGVAVALALTLPLFAIAIAGINLLLLITYTSIFKGLPGAGNLVVGVLVGSTFLFGAGAIDTVTSGAWVLGILAGVVTITREITKDVEDIAGDREAGLSTLPIVIGERPALHVGNGVLALAILASPLPYVQGEFGVPYLVGLVPAVAVMAYSGWLSYEDPSRGASVMKYGMLLAVVAFFVGRIAVVL